MKKIGIILICLVLCTGCQNTISSYKSGKDETTIISEKESKPILTEEELVSYISKIETEVEKLTTKESASKEIKDTLKRSFITLTDFIFYDGKINNWTFKDLTTQAKNKVLNIWESMDQKIEKKVPNYKEKITNTSQKVYSNIKEKATSLKEELLNKYKEEVGEEGYHNTIEIYKEDKKNVQEVIEKYKQAIGNAKQKTSEAKEEVTNWYQDWKESSE